VSVPRGSPRSISRRPEKESWNRDIAIRRFQKAVPRCLFGPVGVDYFFVTREEFERRRDAGELLEWAEVHGNLYGTPAGFVAASLAEGVNVLLGIDVQGGTNIKERHPDAVLVFLAPPDLETLRERLRARATDDDAVIRRRLENAKREMEYFNRYDYVVINDDVDRCSDDCLAIIRAEALRKERTAFY
jgi:guanylate kinase